MMFLEEAEKASESLWQPQRPKRRAERIRRKLEEIKKRLRRFERSWEGPQRQLKEFLAL